jgi:hypothetical protein
MSEIVPRGFLTSLLYDIKIWGQVTSRGVVGADAITKFGLRTPFSLSLALAVATGHLNHLAHRGKLKQRST